MSAMKGILWAARQVKETGGLPRDNSDGSAEQSDAMCQLLRLLILCYSDLSKEINEISLVEMIKKLHRRIFDFCIVSGNDNRGGVKYQLQLDTTCSWCVMFCVQALDLWRKKTSGNSSLKDVRWMDYFV